MASQLKSKSTQARLWDPHNRIAGPTRDHAPFAFTPSDGNRRMLGVESGAMALHREVVVLSGQLTGMGREASCTLNALRVSLPGTIVSHFANCNIHHAPRDLPDGEYLMT